MTATADGACKTFYGIDILQNCARGHTSREHVHLVCFRNTFVRISPNKAKAMPAVQFSDNISHEIGDSMAGVAVGEAAVHVDAYAVPWILNEQASSCMRCDAPFSYFTWKRHCRLCGCVVCAKCSPHLVHVVVGQRRLLERQGSRACTHCVERQQQQPAGRSLLFFQLLPLDLQLHVLKDWVLATDEGNQLMSAAKPMRILSDLDIACCNKFNRQSFLSLIGHSSLLPASLCCDVVNHELELVCWMQSRSVQMKSLRVWKASRFAQDIFDRLPFTLSFVESLSVRDGHHDALVSLFRLCPRITSLHTHENDGSYFFQAIQTARPVYLKQLIMNEFTLEAADKTLVDLNIRHKHLDVPAHMHGLSPTLNFLVSSKVLGHLQTLSCSKVYNFSSLLLFLADCKELRELTLSFEGGPSPPTAKLESILCEAQQLQSFKLVDRMTSLKLGTAIANYSHLQRIDINSNFYCKRTAELQLQASQLLSSEEVEAILHACTHVSSVIMYGPMQLSSQILLGDKFGVALRSLCLTQSGRSGDPMDLSPLKCSALKKLNLQNFCIHGTSLQRLVEQNTQLEYLTISAQIANGLTDQVMEVLFAGCPLLKEVCVGYAYEVTFRSLQAILDNRLHLKNFKIEYSSIRPVDIQRFSEMAKEQGLLPAPKILANKW